MGPLLPSQRRPKWKTADRIRFRRGPTYRLTTGAGLAITVLATLYLNLPEESMADVEQFKDDLETNADGLIGGSRGDFMEALGEAVYARVADDQVDSIIAAYLTLQEVIDANVDNLEEEADEAIDEAKAEFNEAVGRILGV